VSEVSRAQLELLDLPGKLESVDRLDPWDSQVTPVLLDLPVLWVGPDLLEIRDCLVHPDLKVLLEWLVILDLLELRDWLVRRDLQDLWDSLELLASLVST